MKLAGIEIAENINLNNKELILNGAAIRTKFFVQTYIISLYTETPILHDKIGVESLIERCLRMQIITPLATSKAVSENIQSGMKEGMGKLYHLNKETIEQLIHVLESSQIQYKDIIDIYYSDKSELKIFKNGKEIYSNKDGKLFAETIFGIYLGRNPKDRKIKEALLTGHHHSR